MRYKFLLINLIGILLLSCIKEDSMPKDDINYLDITPDTSIYTIRGYYKSMNPFCDLLPIPNDSIAIYEFDLDNDSVDDFQIQVKHHKQEITEYCGHCEIFHIKTVIIKPLTAFGYISLDTQSEVYIRNYDTTEVINNTDIWSNNQVLALMEDGCMLPAYFDFTLTYWGLKLNDMLGWIHLERINNNGIKIYDYALNRTKERPIEPGQKK